MPTVYKLRNYKFVYFCLILFLSFLFWHIHYFSTYGGSGSGGKTVESKLSNHYNPKEIYDNKFCFISNVFEKSIKEFERITLVLHSSHDKLFGSLPNHVKNWDGPISITISIIDKDAIVEDFLCTKFYIDQMRKTNIKALQKLSVHFLLPKGFCYLAELSTKKIDCSKHSYNPNELIERMAKYPINFARNLARKMATTKYIVMADMDHMFSKNFEKLTLNLAEHVLPHEQKTVLVYRIFEISNSKEIRQYDKDELERFYKIKAAQEFHKFYGAHSIPHLDEWFNNTAENPDSASIQFYQPYKNHEWEPQFVSLTNIPFHDQSFSYPLRDNTVLRWEMCRAGYQFAIMNDVFMYHPGIKTVRQNRFSHYVKKYLFQHGANSVLRKFNKRMDKLYPNTKKICPSFAKF